MSCVASDENDTVDQRRFGELGRLPPRTDLEMRNVDFLHERVDLVTATRACSWETVHFLGNHRAVFPLDHARSSPIDRSCRFLGLFDSGLFLLGHQPELDVLFSCPVVGSEAPLGVARCPKELDVRVATRVVKLEGKRGKRLVRLVLGRSARRGLLFVLVIKTLFQSVQEHFDLFVGRGIHNLSYRLVEREITDDIADETFDVGELTSGSWEGEADFGDGDGAGVGFDQLSVEILGVEDVDRVDAAFGWGRRRKGGCEVSTRDSSAPATD